MHSCSPIQDRRFLIFALLCLSVVLIIYRTMSTSERVIEKIIDRFEANLCQRQFEKVVSANRKCLLNKTEGNGDIWGMLDGTVDECTQKSMWEKLDVRDMKGKDDVKWAILPGDTSDSSCIEVTLGVGRQVVSEERLLKELPRCKLYGADPTLENGQVFNKVGKYFQTGISDKNGTIQGKILQKDSYKYAYEQIQTTDFMHFVQHMAKVDRIDYLWMDIEGGEYSIISKYLIHPTITICQWSMEMHGPVEKYWLDQNKFNTMIRSVFQSSPFLSIVSEPIHTNHGLFLVNVKDGSPYQNAEPKV